MERVFWTNLREKVLEVMVKRDEFTGSKTLSKVETMYLELKLTEP